MVHIVHCMHLFWTFEQIYVINRIVQQSQCLVIKCIEVVTEFSEQNIRKYWHFITKLNTPKKCVRL